MNSILPYNFTFTYPTGTPTLITSPAKLYRMLPKPAYTRRTTWNRVKGTGKTNQNTRRHSQYLKQTGSCSNTIFDHPIRFLSFPSSQHRHQYLIAPLYFYIRSYYQLLSTPHIPHTWNTSESILPSHPHFASFNEPWGVSRLLSGNIDRTSLTVPEQ